MFCRNNLVYFGNKLLLSITVYHAANNIIQPCKKNTEEESINKRPEKSYNCTKPGEGVTKKERRKLRKKISL